MNKIFQTQFIPNQKKLLPLLLSNFEDFPIVFETVKFIVRITIPPPDSKDKNYAGILTELKTWKRAFLQKSIFFVFNANSSSLFVHL